VTQTPASDETFPVDRAGGDGRTTAPDRGAPRAYRPALPPTGDGDRLLRSAGAQGRICILCGGPLRAGQRLIRVHGSTIHAGCGTAR